MFKNSEEFGQYLQDMIDRHRKDLSILLQDEGIDAEPTPKLLLLLYEQHGDSLIQMLSELYDDDNLVHLEGESTVDKLTDLFNKGKELVNKANNALGGGSSSGSSSGTPAKKEEEKKEGFTTKKIVIIGTIVIVVLIAIIVWIKKRKG